MEGRSYSFLKRPGPMVGGTKQEPLFTGFGVRVLKDMAEKAALVLAGAMAPRAGERELVPGEVLRRTAYARVLFMACAAIAVAAPVLLVMPLGIAVALPAGVTLAFCILLLGVTAGLLRFAAEDKVEKAEIAAEPRDPYALCAGVVLRLDPQGVAVSLSGRDRADFATYLNEPVGRSLVEQVHVSDRLGLASALDRLREGATVADVECRLERRAGHAAELPYLHARASLTAETGEDGELTGIFCQLGDIGAEMALRDAARLAQSDAENANEAKSRFLAAVSHELRTPLNAILGFSDILIGEYFGKLENDRQREYVALIRQSGGHLLSVVNTMLDMSKIEAGRYELIPDHFVVADVVNACEAMLSLQAREKGVTLTARVQRDLGEAVADQRAIQQILINLVGNAIKFTGAGGVVSMDAVADAGWLKISISDTGIGMAPDMLANIGQPFLQAQSDLARRYEGTGLGLSLVKGLVALHGGTFAIESRQGEGTMVTIMVPMDGSGISEPDLADEHQPVEFPPRLKNGHVRAAKSWDDDVYENAKAQSA